MGKVVDEAVDDTDTEDRGTRRANSIDVHVGGRVRLRRMVLGMSQEKLGDKLGLTFQQVQKYEKGVNRIGAGRLFELSHVLNVPVQFFYDDAPTSAITSGDLTQGGFGERNEEHDVVDFLSTREGLELNKAFLQIDDPRVRRSVIDLVRSIAKGE